MKTTPKLFRTCQLLLLFIYAVATHGSESGGQSVYQFESDWRNQNNQSVQLDSMQGELQLVAFVYTYCEHTCPLIISQIQSILAELPSPPENTLHVTLISLDPERDTPSQLKAYMEQRQLPENLWTMLTGDPDNVRVLSNLFDVKYKAMSTNELAHSNMITLVDREGVIQYQLKGLNEDKAKIIEQINLLASN